MMKILGIDPGLKATGYGCIEANNRSVTLIETGTIEPKENDLIQNRIQKVYSLLSGLIKEHKPQVLVLEKLYAHYKHPVTASKLGHVRGVICLLCAQESIELVEHSVKRVRKSLTGNGNATKVQTREIVADILRIDGAKLPLDASDALALALGYARMQSHQL
ncbi:MAG: crossover junction endodeoxyribonuclease RuvC [Candidatus Omnitrophica bacterium]|nr:crossover junction endodeoxyribonuclease RuvC [Candidatus Omnitrophota bacterium]